MTYRTDWAAARRETGFAAASGAVFGAAVGMVRLRGGLRYAVAAALQSAVFAGSFVGLREGYRHLLRVQSWRDDWYAINTLSAGTGGALFAAFREGMHRPSVMRAFTGASVLGLVLSIAYEFTTSTLRNSRLRARGIEPSSAGNEPWISLPTLPRWFPFRKISKEELEEVEKAKQRH